jgi:Right handed beta helix region
MKRDDLIPRRRSAGLLAIAATMILSCFASSSTALPSSARETGETIKIDVGRKTARFVAVNGDDDGPGTFERPWATINHAVEQVQAGDTVLVRGGDYVLPAQARIGHSGRSDAWITISGYPGEHPTFDAQRLERSSPVSNNGAIQIEGVSYIRIANLAVINSHDAGFTVRDSSHVDLINNSSARTFSSGIAVWDSNRDDKGTEHIRIIGNTITKATTWQLVPADVPRRGEPPHEAISIAGAVDFEVAYNHIYNSDKEGIDIKETSKRGKIHHNVVDSIDRQGIYVDAWFGGIEDIEIFSNVVYECRGAGLVVSVENGLSVDSVSIHHNLVFNNQGSGLLFSKWGVDNPRRNIRVFNNVFYHNGYGPPTTGQEYYWLTGGLYLSSTNLHDVSIEDNIFSANRGFQIGYSDLFTKDGRSWNAMAQQQNLKIDSNLIDGSNIIDAPIQGGGYPADQVKIFAVNGDRTILGNPLFNNVANQDFSVRRDSPALAGRSTVGVYGAGTPPQWWKSNFPPNLVRIYFDSSKR